MCSIQTPAVINILLSSSSGGGGDNRELGLSSPSKVSAPAGFQLLDSKALVAQSTLLRVPGAGDSDEEESLIVDENPAKTRAATTTIKPASLKLKLSGVIYLLSSFP